MTALPKIIYNILRSLNFSILKPIESSYFSNCNLTLHAFKQKVVMSVKSTLGDK